MRSLSGLGPRPDALEVDVLAVVARLILRPDRLDRLDPLGHDRHPHARVGAVVEHLLPVPAGAHAELQAPAGEMVDARHLLGGGDRVALDNQADAAADRAASTSSRRPRSARRTGHTCGSICVAALHRPGREFRDSPGCACARGRTATRARAARPGARTSPGRRRRALRSSRCRTPRRESSSPARPADARSPSRSSLGRSSSSEPGGSTGAAESVLLEEKRERLSRRTHTNTLVGKLPRSCRKRTRQMTREQSAPTSTSSSRMKPASWPRSTTVARDRASCRPTSTQASRLSK